MTCSYCLSDGNEIVESHTSYRQGWERGHVTRLCASCSQRVVRLDPKSLLDEFKRKHAVHADRSQWYETILNQAQNYKVDGAQSDSLGSFAELSKSDFSVWMPMLVKATVSLEVGKPLHVDYSKQWGGESGRHNPDGRHRLCASVAWGNSYVRACPVVEHPFEVPDYHYQTLVLRDHIIEGEREFDRWRLWPQHLRNKSIVECGCAQGQDGIHLSRLAGCSYVGVDRNVDLARRLNDYWNCEAQFIEADMNVKVPDLPAADVLWIMSSMIQINRDAHMEAFRRVGPSEVYLESHRRDGDPDDPHTAWYLGSLPCDWTLLGESGLRVGVPGVRRLFHGKVRR